MEGEGGLEEYMTAVQAAEHSVFSEAKILASVRRGWLHDYGSGTSNSDGGISSVNHRDKIRIHYPDLLDWAPEMVDGHGALEELARWRPRKDSLSLADELRRVLNIWIGVTVDEPANAEAKTIVRTLTLLREAVEHVNDKPDNIPF